MARLPTRRSLLPRIRPQTSARRVVVLDGMERGKLEVERRRAAYELAAYVRALQHDDDIGRIDIIAHSHGGNVARRALRYLDG